MNPTDLIKEWPQWQSASPREILDSPAFAMPVHYDGHSATVTPLPPPLEDTLDIAIRFDDTPCLLSLGKSKAFPDLFLLWQRRNELPPPLLLALIEKECGQFLQSLENATRMQLSIIGLAEEHTAPQRAFSLGPIPFALELFPQLENTFGKIDHLNLNHDAIRSMTRDIIAQYAVIPLPEGDISSLEEGDALLLPDNFQQDAIWRMSLPDDNVLRLIATQPASFSFANFADDTLPDVPPSQDFRLALGPQIIAEGSLNSIGDAICFKLTHLR